MRVHIDEDERYPDYWMEAKLHGNYEVSVEFFNQYQTVVASYERMQEKLRELYKSPKRME